MYKPKPILALTCLLDLLFVLIFASLLLVDDVPGDKGVEQAKSPLIDNRPELAHEKPVKSPQVLKPKPVKPESVKPDPNVVQQEEPESVSRDLGIWAQYSKQRNPLGGEQWVELGRYQLRKEADGKFRMYNLQASYSSTKTLGITHVKFTSEKWSFYSDIGPNRKLFFLLERVDENSYRGWSKLYGRNLEENLWKRVGM